MSYSNYSVSVDNHGEIIIENLNSGKVNKKTALVLKTIHSLLVSLNSETILVLDTKKIQSALDTTLYAITNNLEIK